MHTLLIKINHIAVCIFKPYLVKPVGTGIGLLGKEEIGDTITNLGIIQIMLN